MNTRKWTALFAYCLLSSIAHSQAMDVWENTRCQQIADTHDLIERVPTSDQQELPQARGAAGLELHIAENGKNNIMLKWRGFGQEEMNHSSSSYGALEDNIQSILSSAQIGNPGSPTRFIFTYHASSTEVQCGPITDALIRPLQKARDAWCMANVGMHENEIVASSRNTTSTSMKDVFENLLKELEASYPAWQWHQQKPKPLDLASVDLDEEEVTEEDIPFMIVEEMPAMGPCKNLEGPERDQCTQLEIIRFTSSNTRYPPIAKDAGIQGTVFVYFVVGKDGKVRDSRVIRSVDSRLDEEALRVVNMLPDFDPGRQQGKPSSVQYTIPVKFIIR